MLADNEHKHTTKGGKICCGFLSSRGSCDYFACRGQQLVALQLDYYLYAAISEYPMAFYIFYMTTTAMIAVGVISLPVKSEHPRTGADVTDTDTRPHTFRST